MNTLAAKITDAELKVMRVLWAAKEPLSMATIRETLAQSSDWDRSTIKTLLRRLCEKGVVSTTKKDVLYYAPQVSEGEYREYKTERLIDRLYRGSAKNLVASLVAGNKLDKSDIEELRSLFKVGE